jgi:hypothetical protein
VKLGMIIFLYNFKKTLQMKYICKVFLCSKEGDKRMIDPAAVKFILTLAADKENLSKAAKITAAVFIAVILFLCLCFHVLTMPFQLLGSFFSGGSYDNAKDLRLQQGYDTYIGENAESTGELMWAVNVKYNYISSYFGSRISPITGKEEMHNGIDIPADYGANVYAALGGTVIISQYGNSYGNYIVISHGDGMTTLYAHNSSLLKRTGDKVLKGEAIAKIGSTGDSTGNHCHFSVMIDGTPVNPLEYAVQP